MKEEDNDEIECEILASYGVFSPGVRDWNKEVNLVSWNGRPAKLDIRSWKSNHEQCGKGITLTAEEAAELVKLLHKILSVKRPQGKTSRSQSGAKKKTSGFNPKPSNAKKKNSVPAALAPFYEELGVAFGSSPEACKSARNTLLKKYHPDKNTANTARATRKTIQIKEAYDKIISWWKET